MRFLVHLISMAYAVLSVLLVLAVSASAENITFAWNYNKAIFDSLDGFKLYKGSTVSDVSTLVSDIPKSDITVFDQSPILLEEHFDSDPGGKYNVTRGSWSYVPETKNMHFVGPEFMVVFEYPAGVSSYMMFRFWPEKSTSDAAQLMSYIKDEAMSAATGYGAYYELRIGDAAGTRYSNWRKCYDGHYGGVDPNGAFPLPRYKQCTIVEGQDNLCPGFLVYMQWTPEEYDVSIEGKDSIDSKSVYAADSDARPLDINKLEIIVNNQDGWLDDIVIGGKMELRKQLDINISTTPVYFAVSAYRNGTDGVLESEISIPVKYEVGQGKVHLFKPGNMRKQ